MLSKPLPDWCAVKLAFHDADTDTDTDILADILAKIVDPLTLDFLVRLGLNFHPMGELRGGVVPATFFLSRTDRNVTTQVARRLAACERRD